jgi:DNA repair exonuclease SbcCD ATPase subunit
VARADALAAVEKDLTEERDQLRQYKKSITAEFESASKYLKEEREKSRNLSLDLLDSQAKEKQYFESLQSEKFAHDKTAKALKDMTLKAENAEADYKLVRAQYDENRDRINNLKKQTQQFQEASVADYQVIESLRKENRELANKFEKAMNEHFKLKSEMISTTEASSLKKSLDAQVRKTEELQSENRVLRLRLDEQVMTVDTKLESMSHLKSSLEITEKQYSNMESKLAACQEELRSKTREVTLLETKLAELDSHVNTQPKGTKESAQSVAVNQKTSVSFELEKTSLTSEIKSLTRQLESSNNALEIQKKNISELHNSYNDRLGAYQSQVTSLQQLCKAERALAEERRKEWEQRLEKQTLRVKELETDQASLIKKYENAAAVMEKESEREKQDAEFSSLKGELDELKHNENAMSKLVSAGKTRELELETELGHVTQKLAILEKAVAKERELLAQVQKEHFTKITKQFEYIKSLETQCKVLSFFSETHKYGGGVLSPENRVKIMENHLAASRKLVLKELSSLGNRLDNLKTSFSGSMKISTASLDLANDPMFAALPEDKRDVNDFIELQILQIKLLENRLDFSWNNLKDAQVTDPGNIFS